MNELEKIYINKIMFENIKHIDAYGDEYWNARELQKMLGYTQWENFNKAIRKAMRVCKISEINVDDYFVYFKEINDYYLTRIACYLIFQNCDPSKKPVALLQNYIYIQTRKQELLEKYSKNNRRR